MNAIKINSAGLLSSIQDCGRFGYQRYGVSTSGAMDSYSLKMANLLVGNDPNSAVIEATLTGPEINFLSDCLIAICGADMTPQINGNLVPNNETIEVKNGDTLSFLGLKNGCRSYIAFAGGIAVPTVMGSKSTYFRAKIGGLDGRPLKQGDIIHLEESSGKKIIKKIPINLITEFKNNISLRVIPGPEIKKFDSSAIHTFLTSEYTVTVQSDRMGLRLSGQPVLSRLFSHDIISSGISQGTIQLPGNGQPIILMADRQTTGGYARIANVIGSDLHLVAQLKPGDKIHFEEISIEKAQIELIKTELNFLTPFEFLPF